MSEKVEHFDDAETKPLVQVTLPGDQQVLVYFPGDGAPLFIEDGITAADLQDYVRAPLSRAVLVARLRTVADMLEDPMAALMGQMQAAQPVSE